MIPPAVAITGIKETIKVLKKEKENNGRWIEKAIDNMVEEVRKLALYYCPYEYGALRDSIRIRRTGKWFDRDVSISFGGMYAPYALWVHEDMTKWHMPPTSAKFLSRAVQESQGAIQSILRGRSSSTSFSKTINRRRV